ncbi:hypothetical protein [Schinkia azotoformans]|uniref:hypothetical protein n=1 Tax=Schinkia azotoformans TaxID=1454 RepID=UPI002DB7B426|nr:hypothetical protein [Schinkia azotoformans]MEC1759873.1 hypothetical protein [Schinkia azotoformans]
MSNKRKSFIQKGERDFIDAVVKAVLKNDVSKEHYLVDAKGLMRYASFEVDPLQPIADIKYENGEPAKVVCVFSKELIEDFHFKAGNDDLTKPWIRKGVQFVIEHGKKTAERVYKDMNV